MRLALPTYNPVKECKSCTMRDESTIAARILSFQLAAQLLRNFPGRWKIDENELILQPVDTERQIRFELTTGTLRFGSVATQIVPRYSPRKGIIELADEISFDLALPVKGAPVQGIDQVFTLFLKLTEIFHARCGLTILPSDSRRGHETWEVRIGEDGPQGWVTSDLTAQNRFGEVADISQWAGLRPEKMATYFFGFNRFCKNYPSPL